MRRLRGRHRRGIDGCRLREVFMTSRHAIPIDSQKLIKKSTQKLAAVSFALSSIARSTVEVVSIALSLHIESAARILLSDSNTLRAWRVGAQSRTHVCSLAVVKHVCRDVALRSTRVRASVGPHWKRSAPQNPHKLIRSENKANKTRNKPTASKQTRQY